MESRKRPHTDDGDISVAKKRVLTSANGTPHVNGNTDQGEEDQLFSAGLENFRKEAIYRKMKYYYRENERSVAKIQELERRNATCEAGLAAMTACWTHLIETLRLLVNADSLSPSDIQPNAVFNISEHLEEESIPQLATAFGEAAKATEALVTKFVHIGGDKGSSMLRTEAFTECQRVQTECAALRSELQMMRKQLQECMESRDKFHEDLQAAENRAERSRSHTVLAVESKQPPSKTSSVTGEAEETQRKPPSPSASPKQSASPPPQSESSTVLLERLQARDAIITDRERQITDLQAQIIGWESRQNDRAKVAYDDSSYQKLKSAHDDEMKALRDELNQIRANRANWEANVTNMLSQTVADLKTVISKRDGENTRLREQRDQQSAEINERKHKETVKLASLHEYKNLAEARGERISILQSELRRCRVRLAANEGRGDLMLFLLNEDKDIASQIEKLKSEKEQLEVKLEALQHALSIYNQEAPDISAHIKAQADAEEKAAHVSKELSKFKEVFGDLSQLPPEVSELAERLETQSAELERLRLLVSKQDEANAPLFEELERLSAAWENIDQQLNNKIFDLSVMEDRLQKTLVEKAKSDNKYFSAMRDKEAIENERKNAARTVAKQNVALERFQELHKAAKDLYESSVSNNTSLEKEIRKLRVELETNKNQVTQLTSDTRLGGENTSMEKAKFSQISEKLSTKRAQYDQKLDSLEKEKEALAKEKEAVHAAKIAAARTVVHKHGSGSKDDGEYQHLRSLLLCSTCGSNFRSVIITKCMHTFCKPCVDARITTRQRKCPACNLQFGQGDVSTLYMQ